MFSSEEIAQFRKICSSLNIDLTYEMMEKFQIYLELLQEWNWRIHLVSKSDAKNNRIIRHFVDSLTIFKEVDISKGASLLDFGSGAGFPAIPIKIVREDIRLTLVESIHKKTLFLQKLAGVLKLREVTILNNRVEDLIDRRDFRKKFDLITAKALGKLKDTAQLSIPFLKTGGLLVAYKGKRVEKEIKEFGSLEDYHFKCVTKIEIPEVDLLRWLVVIDKIKSKERSY